jgi:hypothetical protein
MQLLANNVEFFAALFFVQTVKIAVKDLLLAVCEYHAKGQKSPFESEY